MASDLLPPVHQPIETVAGVSDEVARMTGLLPGTPVVAGSADHVAAALASGLTQDGDILLKFGGAGDILYCDSRPEPDPHFSLITMMFQVSRSSTDAWLLAVRSSSGFPTHWRMECLHEIWMWRHKQLSQEQEAL